MTDDNAGVIVRVASRGDGVTADGRYIPLAAPGDRLAEGGGLIEGPQHQTPPCHHFHECGGCQLQHLTESASEGFARDRISEALRSQNVDFDKFEHAHISPAHSRRRVALRAAKLGKSIALGFSGAGSHRIIDMHECPIMEPRLFSLVAPLRDFAEQWVGRKAQWQCKLALVDQGIDLLIEGYEPEGLPAIEALTDFARENGLARLSVDGGYGPETRYEPEPVTVTLGGVAVPYPAYAFLQATEDGQHALQGAVVECVSQASKIADLFAG